MTELGRAVRGLLRTPGPTVAAVAAVALGIGSATAIFSVADAVVLRPLHYAEADRLVSVEGNFLSLGMRDIGASAPELLDYRARARSFDGIVAFSRIEANLTGGGDPERLAAARVSPDVLPLLGVTPAVGRAFAPGEGQPGGDAVAILSWGLWQRRFAGDGAAIGRSIVLDGRARTVVGVTPRGFAFPPAGARFGGAADVFVPLALSADDEADRSRYSLGVLARRRSEAALPAAAAEMAAIARALESEYPRSYRGPGGEDGGWRISVVALREVVVGGAGRSVGIVFAAGVTLLLLGLVDLAQLLLARRLAPPRRPARRPPPARPALR